MPHTVVRIPIGLQSEVLQTRWCVKVSFEQMLRLAGSLIRKLWGMNTGVDPFLYHMYSAFVHDHSTSPSRPKTLVGPKTPEEFQMRPD